jgi:DNA recombination protein Rad52
MGFSDTTTRKLRAKLNGDNIRTREWNGKTLSYIEGWHALSEANRIFGFDGWNRETVELKCIVENKARQSPHCAYIARVRISVQAGEEQIVREGTGAGYTVAEAHALAAKEAETDATKRALATFGNPFGLALYDREQKNVRRAKPSATKRALWVVKDSAGAVTGKFVDRVTCASSVVTAFEEAETVDVLKGLWGHNEPLIAKLQNLLTQNPGENASASSAGSASGNGGTPLNDPGIDLLATYQQCFTKLRDKLSIDDEDASIERDIDDAAFPKNEGRVDVEIEIETETETETEPNNTDRSAIDKSVLSIGLPKRIRAPEHLKWVATLPCLVCQRQPSDAHHLKRVQPNAMGRKPGDQWVVPLCRIHHRALHDAGDETRWWENNNIAAADIAQKLWSREYST